MSRAAYDIIVSSPLLS